MKIVASTLFFNFFFLITLSTYSQINFTANTLGKVPSYSGNFYYGSNMGYYPSWDDKSLADIAAGNPAKNIAGAGVKTLRPSLTEGFFNTWGYDISLPQYSYFASLGIKDMTVFVGDPIDAHRDHTSYGGCGTQSLLFANMYTPIWDGGANGTPINDDNYYAVFIYNTVIRYKTWVKFWEIENEPDFDLGGNAYKTPGQAGNWWENNPKPCDLENTKAPIFHYIRMMRIAYEVIKYVDPTAYVTTGGIGYPSFLDAMLRNTDNPTDGSVNTTYPNKGGAYFDVLSFHEYPYFTLRYWSNAVGGFVYTRHSDASIGELLDKKAAFKTVLTKYGYNGTTYPEKLWIITESNIPRKSYSGSTDIGSDDAQRNYILKALVMAQKNDIKQFYVFNLGDGDDYSTNTDPYKQMGLYKKLSGIGPYNQQYNSIGIGYKTTSDILYQYKYDASKTSAMNLPSTIEGGAFQNAGKYIYVLWAKTSIDQSESASATYSFPTSGFSTSLEKRSWNYSQSKSSSVISSQSVALSGTPTYFIDNNSTPVIPVVSSFTPTSGAVGVTVIITGTGFNTTASQNTVSFNGTTATITNATATQLTVTVPTGATSGKISVTAGGQTGTSTTDFTVTLPPVPTITGFSPVSGLVGTTVVITGTNFSTTLASNIVKFNGTTATVTNATATQLTVTVPTGATTGKITVTVGGQTGTSTTDFTVTIPPVPTITNFTPVSGLVGTTVVITGTNFSTTLASNIVKFNGTTATVTNATATQLTVTVPSTATTGKISVTVGGQTGTSTTDFTITIPPVPTITGFSPTSGSVGDVIIITGTNFSTTLASNAVKFNGTTATVTNATATQLTVTVPTGATSGKISVMVSGQTGTSTTDFTITIPPVPTITGFSPTSGSVGDVIIITGTNFSTTLASNAVKFNGTTATVTNATATQLTVTVPSGATTGKITVMVSGQTGTSTTDFTVTLPIPPSPTIMNFTPVSGLVGSTVVITGTNFSTTLTSNAVKFNGTTATVTNATATQLTVTVPTGATSGKISVTVGVQTGTSTTDFTVTIPPVPTITNFTPVSGLVGTTVVITGTNFSTTLASNIVKFNGTTATVTNATATQLTVTVPTGATSGKISVTVGGQTGTSTTDFTVTLPIPPTPTISNFTPVSGIIGSTVVITGTNFSAVLASNTVKFNGVIANVVDATVTQLTVIVPSGAATGKISVTVAGQTGTSTTDFTIIIPVPTPSVTSFTPTSGVVGTVVIINGSNFSTTLASNIVQFNGTVANVTNATGTQLTVTVPSGATTGKVTVTVGGQTGTSLTDFTVIVPNPPPVISSFSPTSGNVGAVVVINGSNFSTTLVSNTVQFNGVTASVTNATTTQLTVNVPSGATTGKVTVLVGGQTAISAVDFTVTIPNPPAPTITGFTPSGEVGSYITITGTNFSDVPTQNMVTINGMQVTVFSSSSNQIVVIIPPGATSGKISITVNSQTAISTTDFAVTPPPVIIPTVTSFSPASGLVGSTVIITGTNFSTTASSNTVTFNGTIAVVTTSSSTQITVTVPTGATTGKISVTVNGQTGTSTTDFSVTLPVPDPTPALSITSFTPASGLVGTSVTITGTSFSGVANQNIVKFNGVTTSVFSASSTQLMVTVPAGATTGKISVTVGGQTATSIADFIVTTTLPAITTISPGQGDIGSSITITGINFSSTASFNTVKINGVTATIISATSTQLVVIVPPGATTGKISVTVSNETAVSTTDFIVTNGGPLATEDEISNIYQFKIYPNPMNLEAVMVFKTFKNETVSLTIYDNQGRLVKTVVEKRILSPNKYEHIFKSDDLTGGLYYCKLLVGDNLTVRKLVVIK